MLKYKISERRAVFTKHLVLVALVSFGDKFSVRIYMDYKYNISKIRRTDYHVNNRYSVTALRRNGTGK